jgi:hypothetical protein
VQGNAAEEEVVVSLAFTIGRKANVLDSRLETTSDDLDAEALAMLKACLAARGAATRRHLRQGSQALLRIMDEANAKQSPTARR